MGLLHREERRILRLQVHIKPTHPQFFKARDGKGATISPAERLERLILMAALACVLLAGLGVWHRQQSGPEAMVHESGKVASCHVERQVAQRLTPADAVRSKMPLAWGRNFAAR